MGLDLDALLDDARGDGRALPAPTARQPRAVAGRRARRAGARRARQADARHRAALAPLGAWIEQLVAESTGKRGVGHRAGRRRAARRAGGLRRRPRLRPPRHAARTPAWHASTDAPLDALAAAGHPVHRPRRSAAARGLGGEFFRWEFATAVAGAVLGINPFDEPNVTESKDNTKRVLDDFRDDGALPRDEPLASEGRLTLYRRRAAAPDRPATTALPDELRRHLARVPADAATSASRRTSRRRRERDARCARIAAAAARPHAARGDRRLRAALPALDRPAAQGRRRRSAASSS